MGGTVESLPTVLQISSLRLAFDARIDQVEAETKLLISARHQIKGSQKLAKVLEYVLALGNHLNRGTSRGACYGFKLDGLLKFMETKGQDGTTLLNYLSGTIMKKSPELKDFDSELTSVPGAANLILEEVRANTLALESDFELATAAQAPPESGLAEWCAKSSDRLKLTRLTAEDMEEAIWDVGAYFGENDGSSLEPFKALVRFTNAFKQAVQQNEAVTKASEAAAMRRERMQAKKKPPKAAAEQVNQEAAAQNPSAEQQSPSAQPPPLVEQQLPVAE